MGDDLSMFEHMLGVMVDQSPQVRAQERWEASQYFENMVLSNFEKAFEYSLTLFSRPEAPPVETRFCALVIYRTLMPEANIENFKSQIGKVRARWFAESMAPLRDRVKKCLLTGISMNQRDIRSLCAAAIAAVVWLESDNWAGILEMLANTVLTPSDNWNPRIGALTAIYEIFQLPIISCESLEKVAGMRDRMLAVVGIAKDLVPIPDCPADYRLDAGKCILFMLKAVPVVFDKEEILTVLISVVQQAMQSSASPLMAILHDLLYEFVNQFYGKMENAMFESIRAVIDESLASQDHNRIVCGLGFWRNLIQLEIEKANVNANWVKGWARDSALLPNTLCQFLGIVDSPEDVDVEEVSSDEFPHIRAQEALRMLHLLNPSGVVAAVGPYISENITSEEWPKVHGAILALTCVCAPPFPRDSYRLVSDGIGQIVIIASSEQACARLRETALWAIGCCIKSYPAILSADNYIDRILYVLNGCMNAPIAVIKRCFNIIYYISVNCPDVTLDTYFIPFMELIMGKVTQNCPIECAKSVFHALHAVITHTTTQTGEWTIRILDVLLGQLASPSVCFEAKAGICSAIRALAMKFKRDFPEPVRIMQMVIEAMRQRNSGIWEEGLRTISSLLLCNPDQFHGVGSGRQVYELVVDGLSSRNVEMITASFCTLGDLFGALPSEMQSSASDAVAKINEFMQSDEFVINLVCPEVVKALALIVQGGGIALNEDEREQIVKWLETAGRLDTKRFDETYAMTLYQWILRAYANMFLVFADDPQFLLSHVSGPCFALVERIWKSQAVSFDMLHEMYYLFHAAGTSLKQKINIKLNRPAVKGLIERGIACQENPKLQEEATYIRKFIQKL